MKIDIKTVDGISVVELSEKLDFYNATSLTASISELVAQGKKLVVINLEDIIYIDSSGLGVLITIMSELKKSGGGLKITGINEFVHTIFKITNSAGLFDIYKTEEEAVKSFQK